MKYIDEFTSEILQRDKEKNQQQQQNLKNPQTKPLQKLTQRKKIN